MVTEAPPAGHQIREWRQRRRLSQLDLATLAGTSTRHLSYLETGRSRPSRAMVLKLSETLDVPLRERNSLLLGAGHAPEYPDSDADPVSRRRLLEVLDGVLTAHDPWPALVLDSGLDVVAANAAVDRLLTLVDPALLTPPVNVVRVTLHPAGLSRYVVNYDAWRDHLLRQLRKHAEISGRADLHLLLEEVSAYARPADAARPAPPSDPGPTFALPMELAVGDARLRFYSTVATFGTPLDVAASELAIETFLPADDVTRTWLSTAT